MPYLPFLRDDDSTVAIMASYPDLYRSFIGFAENVFKGDLPLSPLERQIIFAYVSGLNDCDYCRGGHNAIIIDMGAAADLIDNLLEDLDKADVDDRLRALLHYARKLTLSPAKIDHADANAVYEAGCDGDSLHATVAVCAMANFMNRLADGCGIVARPENFANRVNNAKKVGYVALFESKVEEMKERS